MSLDQDQSCRNSVNDFTLTEGYDVSVPEDSVIENASFDLLEEHQAKEQARLLHRFKELRHWQQQQQQQLMHQQQQQLKAWQDEQSKVQLLIATQQGAPWNKGLKPSVGGQKPGILTPPSRPHHLAENNAQRDTMQVNQSHGAGVSLDSGLASSMQDTLKSQNSLPKPVMYIDPSQVINPNDEDKYTNSELFSNPGSHDDQLDILKGDDSQPATDWMSDNSDSFIPTKLPPPRPIRGGRNGGVNDQLAGLEHLLSTAPAGLLQEVLNLLPMRARKEPQPNYSDEIELSASPTLSKPGQQPRVRKLQFHQPVSGNAVQSSTSTVASLSHQLKHQEQQLQNLLRHQQQQQQHQNNVLKSGKPNLLNLNSDLVLAESEQDRRYIPRAVSLNDDTIIDRYVYHGADEGDEVYNDEFEDQDDNDEEDDDYDNQNITAKEVQNVSHDDRPIHGLTGKKCFEQLLEEHLGTEENMPENLKENDKPHRKPFLKKGEGISRFNSAPKKPPKKLQKKSDRKPIIAQTNGLSRGTTKMKHDSEGNQAADVVDANKRHPFVTSGLKDVKKSAMAAKPMEKKVKSNVKTNSSSIEGLADKSVAKPALIHNVIGKLKDDQKFQQKDSFQLKDSLQKKDSFQQKDSASNRADKDAVDLVNNGNLSEINRSPNLDSKSNRSDDRDSSELDSLAEFEFLEDVMDNISFRSNSSLVQKLLINDRQGQKELLNKLKTYSDTKGTNIDIQARSSVGLSRKSSEKGSSDFIREAVIDVGINNGRNGNRDCNNSSNINTAESESSDGTLTESSDEDNSCRRSDQFRRSETSSQNDIVVNSNTVSNSCPPLSPSKVMPRKVAPLASRFAAANDTLSMLKSLSLQAGFLTGSHVPVNMRASMNATSKQEGASVAVSSLISDLHGFQASNNSRNHHNIQSSMQYSLAPSNFSESSNLPNGLKLNSAPILYGDATQSSVTHCQNNWPESNPKLAGIPSSQVTPENASQYNSQAMSPDANTGALQKKSYDRHHYQPFSDSNSDDSGSSNESDDDFSQTDRIKFARGEEGTSVGGRRASQVQFMKVASGEPPIAAAPSTCFDDEASWTDEDEESRDTEDRTCLKIVELAASTTASNGTSPPTSKLMSKLFPKLKPKPSSETEKTNQALQQASAQPVPMSNGLQSHILREKLRELDKEIEKFRSENANLDMLRREREEGLAKLKLEIENFQREKEGELKRLEEFKTEEVKKLKRERKLFDSYQKKVRSMPDKRDREEIDVIKMQLQELQDELKRKESRWNASTARLKDRLSELELENGELKEEIRILEKKRLEWVTAQSGVKTSVHSNVKIAPGEGGNGRSSGGRQALPTQVRSSTPTKEMDKVKVSSSVGLRDNSSSGSSAPTLRPAVATLTSGSNIMTRNGRSNKGSNIQNGQAGPVSHLQNGALAPSSRTAAPKLHTPSSVHSSLSGDGLQNNSVPMMMENTLPVAVQVSAMPGSLTSSMSSSSRSAALIAIERAVIDKGDVSLFVEVKHQDGKVERTYKTGTKEIHFPNGTVKEISADGQTIICRLANGDIRQIFPDHRVVYIFAEAQIMQTTFPDGLETFQFDNGQIERRYPDGTVEITFPSKDVKYLFPDGGQEVILTDGTVMQYNNKGERIVEYPSGDREVHTAEYQRREFPNGIVKTVYADGRHETRFPDGRIRLRDKAGNVIMDQIVYR